MKRINKILILATIAVLSCWGITYAVATIDVADMTALAQGNADMRLYVVNDPNGTAVARYVPMDEALSWWTGSTAITTLGTVTTGTINHEAGGLEADVSGYGGLVGINGGSTLDADTLAELLTAMTDVTKFFTDDDIVGPSADPDVDASGELGIDTDGANEPNDVVLRTADTGGDTQYALASSIYHIHKTVITPNDFADATRDACPLWQNNTGMTFTITKIVAWADTDDTTVNMETYDSDWDNNATVDALEIASDATANYYVIETTITAATIANGSWVVADFDDTDDPGWVTFDIMGYFNADVD